MATTPETTAFERGIEPVIQMVIPDKAQDLVSFEADPALKAEIDALAEKSTEGELTPAERAKYAGYVRANKFVAVLQRQARRILASSS